jgi:lipopolysaccharide biosynthesis regulator YciM
LGFLVGVAIVVWASYLTQQNRDLMYELFRLGKNLEVPLYLVFIGLFLIGFLPTGTQLLLGTLRRDLKARKGRLEAREEEAMRSAFRRGADFLADGQPARAAAQFQEVLSGRPDDFVPLLHYGEALRALGRTEQALDAHRKGSALYPQSVALLYQLTEDYEARGETKVAAEVRARILREYPGFGLRILRLERDRALSQRDWKSADALQTRIESLLREGDDRVTLAAERGVSLGLKYQRGVAALEDEQIEPSVAIFQELLAEEPRFVPARIMLGEAELVREKPEAAVSAWRRGYEETGSPVFLQRIEDHFIEDAQPEAAIETLQGLIANAKNDLLPRFFLGRLYYRIEMHEDALRVLRGLGDRIHSSPTYHFIVARIHERRGEMGQAVAAFQRCIEETGVAQADFVCRVCRRHTHDWVDRCDRCGSWNSVELDFEEEHVTARELGVVDAPVWGGYEDSGEWPLVGARSRV